MDHTFLINSNDRIAKETVELKLTCMQEFATKIMPGQFLHIRVPNAKQLTLRRPISIHAYDEQKRTITLQYAIKGEGTAMLSRARVGEQLSALISGNGFAKPNGENVFLLGGGIGIAPLYALMQAYPNHSYTLFLGWRNCAYVFSEAEFKAKGEVNAFTDDGTYGAQGFALDGMLSRIAQGVVPNVIYACGPMPMLKALQSGIRDSIACFVSLEERMGCGFGACLTCNCGINTPNGVKYKRVCVDGPVFKLGEVVFA